MVMSGLVWLVLRTAVLAQGTDNPGTSVQPSWWPVPVCVIFPAFHVAKDVKPSSFCNTGQNFCTRLPDRERAHYPDGEVWNRHRCVHSCAHQQHL